MQLENLEAENMFIGALLKDDSIIKETKITDKHLYDYHNKKVLEIVKELDKNDETIDIVSVVLLGKGELDQKVLSEQVNSIPSIHAYPIIERQVLETYKLKEANRIKNEKINKLSDIETIKKELDQLGSTIESDEYDHKEELVKLYDSIENQKKGLSGYDTGYRDLNKYLDGFQEGDLIISAARPSMGKTAKMLAHANKHCQNGQVTVIFSLEMGKESLNKRMLSLIGKINGGKMRNPKQYFNGDDWNNLTMSMGILSEMNLYIYDKSTQTPSYIREKVSKLRSKYPDKEILVMIDYLQLMRPDEKQENKNLEVGEITRSLTTIAKDFSVPVYLLSQLSRGVEQRQDKRPMASDIRDSGSVEQDADIIELLYRDDYYNEDSEGDDIIEVIIAKQRNGPVGTVELAYKKEHNGFYDIHY